MNKSFKRRCESGTTSYLASGGAYTRRYDEIIIDIPRKTKCVDDTVLWDEKLADHWWRMIDYSELMRKMEFYSILKNSSFHKKK